MIEYLNIGIRFALFANLMLLFGLPLFALYALRGAERLQPSLLPVETLICWLAVSGIALSVLSITAMTASMAGVQLLEVDTESVKMMIYDTPMGNAWFMRVIALIATLFVAFRMTKAKFLPKLIFVTPASAVALASVAWTGHGAAGEGSAGTAQLIADVIHLLGAGAWFGALFALTIMLFRRAESASEEYLRLSHRLLQEFSVAGTVIVALVFGSGLVNGWMLVGPQNVFNVFGTPYGQILVAKLVLFGMMLSLAAANRFSLTPAFERALQGGGVTSTLTKLRKSLVIELSLAVIIVVLVAWLGTLQPPAAL
ncbi:copper homeostasis membrane protein CopD [Sphingorhabdus sp.]|uniref:copper homeostasis membrane protein CopD n=1 Tax=Sphingorhabdus sp. TaxID=1902408 RepID=UPI00398360CC